MAKKQKSKRYVVVLNGKEGQQAVCNTNSLLSAFNTANKLSKQLKNESNRDCSGMIVVGDQSNGRTYGLDRFYYKDVSYINRLDKKRSKFWNKKSGKKN